jgi:tetraacyldisaccharide 4'-kinase
MVEFLVTRLKGRYRVATLSRGYKRKTRGYALADADTTALDIGDEPMQFHLKFPDIPVAVGEQRIEAIPQLLHDRPETEVIILDDAFQHRAIQAGMNILLTDCNNLFTRDFYLPTGDLRDLKSNYKRADVIVVTKCRPDLSTGEKEKIALEIAPLPHQQLFFASLDYGKPYHISSGEPGSFDYTTDVLLVSGIANPKPLKLLLEQHSSSYQMMAYPDHHIFTIDDLRDIRKKFGGMPAASKIILTTEKDAVRLIKFKQEIADLPLYIIPIRHHFLFGEEGEFLEIMNHFIRNFKASRPVESGFETAHTELPDIKNRTWDERTQRSEK